MRSKSINLSTEISFYASFDLMNNSIALTMNMYLASLRYTSTTFVTSMFNTIASLTFVIAIILRMEVVDARSSRGIAKILGTLISLAGVTTLTLYKGPALQSMKGALVHINRGSIHENWTRGSILAVVSCISWSLFYIMQAVTLKKYPAQLSLTAWMNCIGGAQSVVFAILLQHKLAAWSIRDEIEWQAIVCSGLTLVATLWCMKQKGPVFVTMFSPLGTVMAVFSTYFIVGEKLYTGSILGGAIVIIGLYLLLWGKERDQVFIKTQEQPLSPCNEPEITKTDTMTLTERVAP
ncbi:hypothetical protein SLEP1_g858 [Rubroshorea leprosula]|uniref:WAT1-related protein n=1 Tax=Rubroshorea leprosula TaxID=152421 RepID=A0AAV5HGM5_9ROSI|nr:hypothetical protein SLEP1_g858 [Rubroshorea leprosula]